MVKQVIKKDGTIEPFDVTKIRNKIEKATAGTKVSPLEIESLIKFTKTTYKTSEIQDIILESVKNKISIDEPELNLVAGRIAMDNLYREVWKHIKIDVDNFEEGIDYLVRNGYYRKDIKTYLEKLNKKDLEWLKKQIKEKNYDFQLVLSQVQVLKTKYLIKNKKGFIEYPIWADIANALILSRGYSKDFRKIFWFIHNQYISLATPFKANLRIPGGNTGSCFIGEMGDNLASIFKSYTDMAFISKEGGGIGWYLGKVRPGGTYSFNIRKSNKINKWIKIINDIAVAVNQRGIRKGAITVALDWWHLDIYDFLEIKSELTGDLRDKCFDIFPQIVVDNYFVDAVLNDEEVYLFNQYEFKQKTGIDVTELVDEELIRAIEQAQQMAREGKIAGQKVRAKDLWKKALWIWVEIGDFYFTHKDNLNKSNYLKYSEEGGIAKCGNLCVESFSLTKLPTEWKEEVKNEKRVTTETDGLYHSCSLVSINASKFAKNEDKLEEVCYYAVKILDTSIDEGKMPVLEAEKSAKALRNIGVGIVGLADYMAWNKAMYDTEEGRKVGEKFVEKISYYCYNASIKLAEELGPYPYFKYANYDKLFGYKPEELNKMSLNGFDWVEVANKIKEKGIRNFLILALAPNTTTGIMMGATASYLPTYNKEMSQTLSDMTVTILPPFIKERYWYYKTKFQYHPADIIKFTRRIQKWIDTGISMEININPEIAKINEISDAILEGFKTNELKAVYYSLTIGKNKEDECADCAN